MLRDDGSATLTAMNADASAFVRRARFFLAQLRANTYPNTTAIQRFDGCSKATAARTIDRLQSEFGFPVAFDAAQRGYVLTELAFTFEFLPPGRDEFSALFLMCKLADTVGSTDIRKAIESLWNAASASVGVLAHDLRLLEDRFSADLTSVATLADAGVLDLVNAAAVGTLVVLTYKSPWRHTDAREYRGLVEKVHLSDGAVYVLFRTDNGRRLVLNASFIRSMQPSLSPFDLSPLEIEEIDLGWLEGFGIWASNELHDVVVRILPPGAEYYAAHTWQVDQQDSWDGPVLIRKFPSMLSPELVRRILSLGRFVQRVEPPALADMVREEIELLAGSLRIAGTPITS